MTPDEDAEYFQLPQAKRDQLEAQGQEHYRFANGGAGRRLPKASGGRKGRPQKPLALKQREHRQSIDVGPGMNQVCTVAYLYRAGAYTQEQAQGAFELAYQQGRDGMGASIAAWMGLTDAEFDAWMRHRVLPPGKKRGAA